jgi:hypothetical protein
MPSKRINISSAIVNFLMSFSVFLALNLIALIHYGLVGVTPPIYIFFKEL